MALVLSMAIFPLAAPRRWESAKLQALVVAACSLPTVVFLLSAGQAGELWHGISAYAAFIVTLMALYVAAGGVLVDADWRATPLVNVSFMVVGSVLASLIGTMGASMLLIRPLLRTCSQRKNTAHLVPFFLVLVANAGGLLTPLGDPPLLVGFVEGVPFTWTLGLWPIWLAYVTTGAAALFIVDSWAYARETPETKRRDAAEREPLRIAGKLNLLLLAAIVGATFLPPGLRELLLLAITLGSHFGTSTRVHERNAFSLRPLAEVALLFAGLFVCLIPVEALLAAAAPRLPLSRPVALFWSTGLCSALLDNVPTYAAFSAVARGSSIGEPGLIAGIAPLKLAAISAGSVVMGATTYIGNGPNLIVKALAERAGVVMPSFFRYAAIAFLIMLPGHLLVTLAFILMEG